MTTTATVGTRERRASGPRLHGLDALRALALGLGIVLHAVLPFAPIPIWLYTDSQTTPVTFLVMHVIHLFRMTVFMLLAGYFGAMVLRRRGAGAYLKDRLLRIGLPFVAFWPIAVGSLAALMVWNGALRGMPMTEPPPPPPGVPPLLAAITPGQLWFLLVLLECVLITLVVRAVAVRLLGAHRVVRIVDAAGRWLSAPGGVVLASVGYLGALMIQGSAQGGILEPTTIVPKLSAIVAYLSAFWIGWALYVHTDGLRRVARGWPIQLAVAVVLTAVTAVLQPDQLPLWAPAGLTAVAGLTWTYALLGIFTTVANRESAVVRYLADSSYWVYLLHLPVLMAIGIPIADQPWPVLIKLLIIMGGGGVLLLISYDVVVRSTWVGWWLNGHRRRSVLLRRG